jgi:hypothetical protein
MIMRKPTESKIICLDANEERAKRETEKAASRLRAELNRLQTPVPQDELDRLRQAALGDTGQSRTCRYLLCLLVGADNPTGFKGEGLLELRTLDRKLAEAFLKILDWWRDPTRSDQPIYDILRNLEIAFGSRERE